MIERFFTRQQTLFRMREGIPDKRADKGLVSCLTRPKIDVMFAAHDVTDRAGRRDHALLLTLYNTGARVSEIPGLHILAKVTPAGQNVHRFKADDTHLCFLATRS